jgi:antitoxin VapB
MQLAQTTKAKVFFSGRSQAVRIPAEFRFTRNEVYVRRDPQTGDLILSESPAKTWAEVFKALDDARFPDDFLEDRDQGLPQKRDDV